MRYKVSLFVWLLFLVLMPLAAQDSPEGVVSIFLEAWNDADYETMYRYLHPESQNLYPRPVFDNRYTAVQEVIGLTGVAFTIQNTTLQGESAAVTYDVVLESGIFETIEDPGRLMRLVRTPNGWRIAWSSMDIFAALAGDDVSLRVDSVPQERAIIYDREGRPLAYPGSTVALYTAPRDILDQNECINLVARLTRQSVITLGQRLSGLNPESIFFLTEMDPTVYQENQEDLLFTCGIDPDLRTFESAPHRVYYGGTAMAHAVGYIGPIQAELLADYQSRGYGIGDLVGLDGIEEDYNDTLSGRPQRTLRIVDSTGLILREIARTEGTPPTSVTLTLDRELQLITVQALSDAFNFARPDWGDPNISTGGAVVILNVKTGEILAMASYPLINPNYFLEDSAVENRGVLLQQLVADGREPLRNRAVSEQQSPGSTFKIITLAAALNEGLTSANEIFNCELYWDGRAYGDTLERRADWRVADEMEAAGEITPAQALMSSCNPFFWQFGARMYNEVGPSTLTQYAQRMGLTRAFGIEGWREAVGEVLTPGAADAAINEAVGQGNVTVPPLQMAAMTAGVANDGIIYKPYLVRQIGGMNGEALVETNTPEVWNDMNFEPGVIDTIKEGMCGVTTNEDYGTAYIRFGDVDAEFHPPAPYSICAKTGTAQTGRYPNAWFVAYTPADDPELAIAVMVEQSLEGSQVSAPIVRRILDDYYQVPRAEFPDWWGDEFPYSPLPAVEGGGAA